jgi:hypothetical protein
MKIKVLLTVVALFFIYFIKPTFLSKKQLKKYIDDIENNNVQVFEKMQNNEKSNNGYNKIYDSTQKHPGLLDEDVLLKLKNEASFDNNLILK